MKRRSFRGILAGLMAVIMLTGMLPISVAAETAGETAYDTTKKVQLYYYGVSCNDGTIYGRYALENRIIEEYKLESLLGSSNRVGDGTATLGELRNADIISYFGNYVSRTPDSINIWKATHSKSGGKDYYKLETIRHFGSTFTDDFLKQVAEITPSGDLQQDGAILIVEAVYDLTASYNESKFAPALRAEIDFSLPADSTLQWYRYVPNKASVVTSDYSCKYVDSGLSVGRIDVYADNNRGWFFVQTQSNGLYKATYSYKGEEGNKYFPVVINAINGEIMTQADTNMAVLPAQNTYYCESTADYTIASGENSTFTITASAPYYLVVLKRSLSSSDLNAPTIELVPAEHGAQKDFYNIVYGLYTFVVKNSTTQEAVQSEPVVFSYVNVTRRTVSFDPAGGTGRMNQLTVASEFRLPECTFTAPAGKYFKCWLVNGEEKDVGALVSIPSNTTVKAVWVDPVYFVAFNANGGTGTMETQQMEMDVPTALSENKFTKDSYKFLYWSTTSYGGTTYEDKAVVTNLAEVAKTVTLYARWSYVGNYTVNFDANGGTGSMDPQRITKQTATALSENTFTRDGYIFAGWNTKADGTGTAFTDKQSVTDLTSSSITLYAMWDEVPAFTVVFDSNGGDGTMTAQKINVGVTAALSANTFTKASYRFAGWNTKADGTGTAYTDKQSVADLAADGESVTLYAVWEQLYTVSFAANGGTGAMENAFDISGDYTLPANAFTAPDGKRFKCWSVNGTEKAVGDTITVTANTTVTAVWADVYTVSFAANGGTGTMTPVVVDASGEYTLPENGFTAPDGKRFKAWSVNGAEKMPGDTVTVTADTTVRALWEDIPVTYMVSFDANGGSGSMVNASGITGAYTLPENGFTAPDGKRFKAWSVNGTEKMPGDTVTIAVDTTVRALWEDVPVTYTVSFDANGGSGSMAGVSGIAGAYTLPENGFTAPDGMQFKCWSVNGTEMAVGDIITLTENITVTAVWAETEITNDDWSWYVAWLMLYNSKFSVTASSTEGGIVTPAGVSQVQYSKDITYTITPDKGYVIKSVLVDGNDVGAVSEYTFANVKKDHTILVIFAAVTDEPATDCDGWDNCPMRAYTDLEAGQWYHDALHYCLENGLMQGMGDGLFNPSGAASRAMIVTILWRIEGCPVVNYAMDFEDVAAEQWYTDAIRWAASENIVEGYGDGRFGTDDAITREQLATILYRYEQYKGGGFKGLWMYRMDYVDLADVSDWAYEAICWMNMNGIVEGRPGKILDPKGTASRVEAAAMIQRYCELTK